MAARMASEPVTNANHARIGPNDIEKLDVRIFIAQKSRTVEIVINATTTVADVRARIAALLEVKAADVELSLQGRTLTGFGQPIRDAYGATPLTVVLEARIDGEAEPSTSGENARSGDDEAHREASEFGQYVHAENYQALCEACEHGYLDVVERLLAAGVDVHAEDNLALRLAIWWGYLPVVERLLSAGANVHASDDDALRLASWWGCLAIVERLLAAGANVHAADNDALRRACVHGHLSVIERLLAAGAERKMSLIWASADGHLHVVDWLLAAGADVHAEDDEALRTVCSNGHFLVVERLLAAGANVHANDDEALRWASANGHHAVVLSLLAAGADVHACDNQALHWACVCGHLSVIERLLAAGADVHAENDKALLIVCWYGHFVVVERLLSAGADVHADDGNALSMASLCGHLPVVERLLAAGANVHACDNQALRWACMHGHLSIIERLLAAGADVHADDDDALSMASLCGHLPVVALANVTVQGVCGSGFKNCQVLAIDFYSLPISWRHFAAVSSPASLQIKSSTLTGGYTSVCCFGSNCYIDSTTISFLVVSSSTVLPYAVWISGGRASISNSAFSSSGSANINGPTFFNLDSGSYLSATSSSASGSSPLASLIALAGQSSAQFSSMGNLTLSPTSTFWIQFGCSVDYDVSMSTVQCVFYPGARFNGQLYLTSGTARVYQACP